MFSSTPLRQPAAAIPALALTALLSGPVSADDDGITVEGGITAVYQHAGDDRIDDDAQASADLAIGIPAGAGAFTLHLEGSTTLPDGHVASLLGEANGDAGTALNADGTGRVQLSELYYGLPLAGGTLAVGLLDATAWLDTSRLANDETAQFLNGYLVNNPTIEFPDYTVGAVWQREPEEGGLGLTLALAQGRGLGEDLPSYSGLFDRNVDDIDGDGIDDDKGLFAAAELAWNPSAATTLRLGVWNHSGDHPRVDGTAGLEGNRGLYGVLDGEWGETLWSLRAGTADGATALAARFFSVAVERPVGPVAVGAGLAKTWVSGDDTSGLKDTTVAELYGRYALAEGLDLTPSVQWLANSNFDGSGTIHDDGVVVVGARLNWAF